LEDGKPEVVVTHEAPLCVELDRPGRDTQPTPKNLDNAFRICEHTPAHWYFGHHHILEDWEIQGTKFHCCGFHGEFVRSDNA
jgi:hypothetical protein